MPDPTVHPITGREPEYKRTMHFGSLCVRDDKGQYHTVDVDVEIDITRLGVEQFVQGMLKRGRDRQGTMGGAAVIAITEST